MKNVLITGGAGFIGSHLVDQLIGENGWNVTVLDDFNGSYSPVLKYHNIACHNENRAFSLFGGDITSERVFDGIFSNHKFDSIIHLADKTVELNSSEDSKSLERTNINGTLNVLEAARANGVGQFIFGSSASVYGNDLDIPFSEEMIGDRAVSPYAATKSVGENLCRIYSRLYNIRCVCLRFFTVHGPRQRPDMAIHKFTRLIEAGKPITFYGDGTTKRDYVYVSDIVDGIRSALDYSASKYEVFNLGSGNAVKLFDLVKILENALKRKAVIERVPKYAGEMNKTLADTRKAEKLLGFKSSVSLKKGIETFVRWFKEEKLLEENSYFINKYNLADAAF